MAEDIGAGGFIPPSQTLPSPAPSGTSSTRPSTSLPHPRGRSLQPGSQKEAVVRRYVEDKMLHVSRRYVKKFSNAELDDSLVGYRSFGEVCRDLDSIVNVLWLSGTRKLNRTLSDTYILIRLVQRAFKSHSFLSSLATSPNT
jgi:hypothetical protein